MRVQVAIPENRIERPVLDAALEAVTRLDESLIRNGEAPTFRDAVHRVRWRPEPPGQEHFDHAAAVLERGHGDCDDLAPWHAASLRVTGEDRGAIATAYPSGPNRWHAVVQLSDGRIVDPSKAAGMGQPRGQRPSLAAPGASVVGAYMIRPQIALTPRYGQWSGRVDIPWQWEEEILHGEPNQTDWAMTTLHAAPTASAALTGAILGAVDLATHAGACHDEHLQRLCCLAGACEGYDWESLAADFGPHHATAAQAVVGSVMGALRSQYGLHPHMDGDLGDLFSEALPYAKEIIPAATNYIPVVGPALAPVVEYGLDLAEKEYREGRAPKLVRKGSVPGARPISREQLSAQKAKEREKAAQEREREKAAAAKEREREQREKERHTMHVRDPESGRWLCIPARWE